jgi:hypothetical protein
MQSQRFCPPPPRQRPPPRPRLSSRSIRRAPLQSPPLVRPRVPGLVTSDTAAFESGDETDGSNSETRRKVALGPMTPESKPPRYLTGLRTPPTPPPPPARKRPSAKRPSSAPHADGDDVAEDDVEDEGEDEVQDMTWVCEEDIPRAKRPRK